MSGPAQIDIQRILSNPDQPDDGQLRHWAFAVLSAARAPAERELLIRIVDEAEMTELNKRYRGKDGSTNVLSFPFESPPGVSLPLIGDLVICDPVVVREAREQNKTVISHWAHMVVHGVLHLLGHDHIEEDQAAQMEQLETVILHELGFPDPYALSD